VEEEISTSTDSLLAVGARGMPKLKQDTLLGPVKIPTLDRKETTSTSRNIQHRDIPAGTLAMSFVEMAQKRRITQQLE
jgi:hypothetical protein